MLKLKKTNLAQQQKSAIQTEEQTQFQQQSRIEQQLTQLLKQSPYPYAKISTHLSTPHFSSISAQKFVNVLVTATSSSSIQTLNTVEECTDLLKKLITIPHDGKQVKKFVKKEKNIDALLLMALLWECRQLKQAWKLVLLIIESFPTEVILNGKEYVQKWNEYFQQQEAKIKSNQQVKRRLREIQLKEKITKHIQSNNSHGFVDNYINL